MLLLECPIHSLLPYNQNRRAPAPVPAKSVPGRRTRSPSPSTARLSTAISAFRGEETTAAADFSRTAASTAVYIGPGDSSRAAPVSVPSATRRA
eukprot:scaffold3184_cov254-Pinguiococcus_pyrenoidosus.AAC.1